MKKIALALALALAVTPAASQTQFPADTVWGNVGPNTALPTTIVVPDCPLGVLSYALGVGFSCVTVSASGGIVGITSPQQTLTVGSGGIIALDINLAHDNHWTGKQIFNSLTLQANTGCLQADGAGVVTGTGTNCGGGATASLASSHIFVGTNLNVPADFGAAVRVNNIGMLVQPSGSGAAPDAPFTINMSTVPSPVAPRAGIGVHQIGGATNGISVDSFTAGSLIDFRTAGGTPTTPTSPATGTQLANIGGYGYVSGAYTFSTAMVMTAAENFSTGHTGGWVDFYATPAGTSNAGIIMRMTGTGVGISPTGQVVPDAPLTINANTVAGIAPVAGTVIHLLGADGVRPTIVNDAFGQQPTYMARRAQGTAGSKLGVVNGSGLARFSGEGWDGSAYSLDAAIMYFGASETWSPTAHGSVINFAVTPSGTTTAVQALLLQSLSPTSSFALVSSVAVGAPVVPPDALITVNANTVAMTKFPPSGGMVHLIGKDNDWPFITIDSFGSGHWSGIAASHANGTAAAPTAVTAGDALLNIRAYGYTSAGSYGNAVPQIFFYAAEPYTATAQGNFIDFMTTPTGTIAGQISMRLQASGGLSVGSANVGADFGNGVIRATSIVGSKDTNGFTSGIFPTPNYQLSASGATNGQLHLMIAYDTNGDRGWIQAGHEGVAYTPLFLNPNGGLVTVGPGGLAITGALAGTVVFPGTAIASGTCGAALTTAAAGVTTADAIIANFIGDPTPYSGFVPSVNGMLVVIPYPTAGAVNFKICNNTAAAITPAPLTINWRVVH